jgi:hypothetical protein
VGRRAAIRSPGTYALDRATDVHATLSGTTALKCGPMR